MSVATPIKNNKNEEVSGPQKTISDAITDPLLFCLEKVSHLLGQKVSPLSLKAGLPLKDGLLTPDLLPRAAERAHLHAQVVCKKLKSLSQDSLLSILLLEGKKSCILLKIYNQDAEVIFPEIADRVTKIRLDHLENLYSGMAILINRKQQKAEITRLQQGKEKASWFWSPLKQFWPIYAQVGLAAILINSFAIVGPFFAMNVYDHIVPHGEPAKETLYILAMGVVIVFSFDFFLKVLRSYFVDTAGKNADVILASTLFEQVMNIKMAARPQSSGHFANQLREYETLRDFFSSLTLVTLIDLPFVCLFIWVIYLIGGSIAYVPLIAAPLITLIIVLMNVPLHSWIQRLFQEIGKKNALLIEAISGLETIKSLGIEGRMQRSWEGFSQKSARSSHVAKQIFSIANNSTAYIQQICTVAVIIVGVWQIFHGQMTLGGLIACSILSGCALNPLSQIVNLLMRFNQSIAALKSLNMIIQMPVERSSNIQFLYQPHIKGSIEFQKVSFTYPNQKTEALKDISFRIAPGEKVGLVGRIGSGKSTLEKLILGLYEPSEGSILIDNTNICTLDPAVLRSHIGYIPQDIFLFYGTVRDNIAMGAENPSEKGIQIAGDLSGVNDFVRHHSLGYEMPVGEGGRELSGGQRQAIAIARALVRDPPILLFDEPTAMMDHASETRFLQKMKATLSHKTLILVTHRMSLLAVVNRIIILDNGKIIADGPRDQILKALSQSEVYCAGAA